VVNGLIRLQEIDTLYSLCQEEIILADKQIWNLEEVISNDSTIIDMYKGYNDSLRVDLHQFKTVLKKRNKLLGVAGGLAILFGLLFALK
jgi:hypothetical protein